MGVKSSEVKIYAPPGFKATWAKFLEICERDGVSASHLVRVWVEGYVKRKDPGNPQRPLTAYVPGHEDQESLIRGELLQELQHLERYYVHGLPRSRILQLLRDRGVPPQRRVTLADALIKDLRRLDSAST